MKTWRSDVYIDSRALEGQAGIDRESAGPVCLNSRPELSLGGYVIRWRGFIAPHARDGSAE